MMNKGVVYALWAYEAQNSDELSFHEGDAITVLRRKDESETEWWWARLGDREGYVPKNLLGVSTLSSFSWGLTQLLQLHSQGYARGNQLSFSTCCKSHNTGHSMGSHPAG